MSSEVPFSWKKAKLEVIKKIKYRRGILAKQGRLNDAKKCDRQLQRIDEK